eukprot:s105_g51.t1
MVRHLSSCDREGHVVLSALSHPTSRVVASQRKITRPIMEDTQELLTEVPLETSKSSWSWKIIGSVAALATLTVGVYSFSNQGRPEATITNPMDFVQDWEEIPGIDTVIEHAKTLELKQPLRNLNDLFYESQPEELPWIRTECVIDVIQGAAYLGQAVVFLYKAIKYDGIRCPDNSPAGCAASIAGFITSVTWIASYLSFAANACGAAVNSGALCAGDWTALMANQGGGRSWDWLALLKVNGLTDTGPGWKQFVPAGATPTVDTVIAVDKLRTADRNRAFDLTQCVVADVTNAAAYIVRAILQIRSAASACPEPKACAINIMNIISSFAWISQFTSLAVSDCWDKGSQKALCAADISDMVAAVTNGPAAGIATTSAYVQKMVMKMGPLARIARTCRTLWRRKNICQWTKAFPVRPRRNLQPQPPSVQLAKLETPLTRELHGHNGFRAAKPF